MCNAWFRPDDNQADKVRTFPKVPPAADLTLTPLSGFAQEITLCMRSPLVSGLTIDGHTISDPDRC